MKIIREHLRFNVDIVSHCNLNCKCCGHFSPLATPDFLDPAEFQRDLERIAFLTDGIVDRIELMGGEPLLHPQVNEFISISRTIFPKAEINICTNGILLEKQTSAFFEICASNDASIAISHYPIKLQWDKIEEIRKMYKVNIYMVNTHGSDKRLWYKNRRDLTGSQDIESNFDKCPWGNNCVILEHGKLATCVMPFKAPYFNKFYRTNDFKITSSDYIDIYKAKSIAEILTFLATPINCCRYCKPQDDELIEWGTSTKSIEEWT